MKILMLDIETAPNKVFVWGLFNQNVALNQIQESGYTLCWAAKWKGEKEVMYSSIQDGKENMLSRIYALVEEADVVVHYNGNNFDMPTLNQEWLGMGWPPPAPYIQIDLLRAVRGRFRFPSNKLSYVAERLGLGGKVSHKGMELWRECMAGVPESWEVMKAYNIQDVVLLENLYARLKPWIVNHPNQALWNAEALEQCPNCGSKHLQKRGLAYAKTQAYQRYACMDCGAWSRSRTTALPKEKRAAMLVGVA